MIDRAYECPYFGRNRGQGKINCECCTLKFPDLIAANEFLRVRCADPEGYKKCLLKKIMDEYYYTRKYADGKEGDTLDEREEQQND